MEAEEEDSESLEINKYIFRASFFTFILIKLYSNDLGLNNIPLSRLLNFYQKIFIYQKVNLLNT